MDDELRLTGWEKERLNDDLVRLSADERAILDEAGSVLRKLAIEAAGNDEKARLVYLAGRLHGFAGRVPEEVESQN